MAREGRSSSRRAERGQRPAAGPSAGGRSSGRASPGARSPEIVYGRNPVREALRGRRGVRRVWATAPAAREPWLEGVEVEVTGAERVEELSGSGEHQGVCAEVDPYTYADPDELLASPAPLLVALDEVQDPQNLGAIARTAESAGATGRRDTRASRRGCHRGGGQGLGRRRRAPAHRPSAQPRRLPGGRQGRRMLGLRRRGRGLHALRRARLPRRGVLVLGAEGRGLRPRVAAACDALVALPMRGRVRSLNVNAAAAVLLYEILHAEEVVDSSS